MGNKKKSSMITVAAIGAAATATVVAGAAALSYAVTDYLVKFALDRKAPKSFGEARKKIGKSKAYGEFFEAIDAASDTLEAKEHEALEITASYDNERLIGHLYEVKNHKRIVLAMHGWRSSWSMDFGMTADFFEKNGCTVLYAEQRGQNNSGGEYMGFGMIERYDCLDFVNLICRRYGNEIPVYLCGVSMGAATVLMASGFDMPANVKGIIADCGFTSPHEIWKHVVENNMHMWYGIRGSIASDLCRRKIQMGAQDYSTVDALKTNKIPVLFIHGTDDNFVPIGMTYDNYKACIAPKRLFVVPGAGHGMSYWTDKEGYEDSVANFFSDFG